MDIFSRATYDLVWDPQLNWLSNSSGVHYFLDVILADNCQYYYHTSNKYLLKQMANDKIDDVFSSIILQIRKNNNGADIENIHKNIVTVDFESITKEFLVDRLYTLITEGKIVNKINRTAKFISETSLISHNETPITTKSTNPSPDNVKKR